MGMKLLRVMRDFKKNRQPGREGFIEKEESFLMGKLHTLIRLLDVSGNPEMVLGSGNRYHLYIRYTLSCKGISYHLQYYFTRTRKQKALIIYISSRKIRSIFKTKLASSGATAPSSGGDENMTKQHKGGIRISSPTCSGT